jgi:hypothetical protein
VPRRCGRRVERNVGARIGKVRLDGVRRADGQSGVAQYVLHVARPRRPDSAPHPIDLEIEHAVGRHGRGDLSERIRRVPVRHHPVGAGRRGKAIGHVIRQVERPRAVGGPSRSTENRERPKPSGGWERKQEPPIRGTQRRQAGAAGAGDA